MVSLQMETAQQMIQLESFWNLIQASDDVVQQGLLAMLSKKFSSNASDVNFEYKPRGFRDLKGIIPDTSKKSDKQILDDYYTEKYDL